MRQATARAGLGFSQSLAGRVGAAYSSRWGLRAKDQICRISDVPGTRYRGEGGHVRQIGRQEVAQPVSPDLLFKIPRAEVDSLAVEAGLFRFRGLLVENLVDQRDRDLLTFLRRSPVLDPVPELRAGDLGSGRIYA